MTGPLPRLRPDQFDELPKVELHRHLEGSLRLDTLLEVARTHGITIPRNFDLRSMVQMQKHDPLTFTTFLSKFQTLRLFYLSPEIIQRITREAIADAALDRVRYMELRFSPMALARAQNFPLNEVMDWVIESAHQAAKDYNIIIRLIASVNRHESPDLAEKIAGLAVERISRGIVGLDLAGNEADFAADPFAKIFLSAKAHGLRLCIHAGADPRTCARPLNCSKPTASVTACVWSKIPTW
jgi:adenosine deaminase